MSTDDVTARIDEHLMMNELKGKLEDIEHGGDGDPHGRVFWSLKRLEGDRNERGYTIGEMAWWAGVSARIYRDIELGAKLPSTETYDRIANVLGWQPAGYEWVGGR